MEGRKFKFVRCVQCRAVTTWRYGWKHGGRCERCADPKAAARLADERRARILARTREDN